MANKIAFINNKGGSAKTTSAVNIAGAFANLHPEKKVLIVESDGQGNATRSFNLKSKSYKKTMYDVFMGNEKAEDCIINAFQNIDLIPANNDMNFVEFDEMRNYESKLNKRMYSIIRKLSSEDFENMSYANFVKFSSDNSNGERLTDNYFNMLSGKFDEIDKKYDLIIFDTPPEIKAITSSILAFADNVVIPYEPDAYSIDGVVNILNRIASIKKEYNPELKIGGVLAVKVQNRTVLHTEVRNRMMKYCGRQGIYYFESEIPMSIKFASSTSFKGLPATITMKGNSFVEAYYDLIKEMEEKEIL